MEGLTTMTPAPMLTIEEYLRTPESNLPQELSYGVWRVADAPTPRHQSTVFAFGLSLDRFVRRRTLGRIYLAPVDVILDRERHLVVQPDLLFIAQARLGIVRDRIWGAPDMALEVLSPHPRIGELEERLAWFAEYGVHECWLVYQEERTIEVVTFGSGGVVRHEVCGEDDPIPSEILAGWNETLASVLDASRE